jgi:hypothetical protein
MCTYKGHDPRHFVTESPNTVALIQLRRRRFRGFLRIAGEGLDPALELSYRLTPVLDDTSATLGFLH